MREPRLSEIREVLSGLLQESTQKSGLPDQQPFVYGLWDGRREAYAQALQLLEPRPEKPFRVVANAFKELEGRTVQAYDSSEAISFTALGHKAVQALETERYRIVHESEVSR